MSEYFKSSYNKVIRGSKRANYDKRLIYSLLDSHFLCHVPYIHDETAIVIPTAYGRKDDTVFIHGSLKNRMLHSLLNQKMVSLTISHLDGLVLARSVFHHSVNYRSVVIFGIPKIIENREEKMEALEIITENIIPGRWTEARIPNEKELDSTLVIAITIEEASAKIRDEGASDDAANMDSDIWAGVLELETLPTRVVKNRDCKAALETPASVLNFRFQNHRV